MKDQTVDTGRDTKSLAEPRAPKLSEDRKWRIKFKQHNLLQYVSTGKYFARVKVNGKTIRRSLDTNVYSTAVLKLSDFLNEQRSKRPVDGDPVMFSDAQKLYEADLDADHSMTENSKRYRRYCIKKLNESWRGLSALRLSRITETDCKAWAGRLAASVDEQYFNNVLGTFRAILERGGIDERHDPTRGRVPIKRLSVKIPSVKLPTLAQLKQIFQQMQTSGAGQQQACADFARFLVYSGCRLSEARKVTWSDVDMDRGVITVHNAKVRKAGDSEVDETRTVPIIKPMRELLARLSRTQHKLSDSVCKVGECEKSLAAACKKVGVQRLTHHKLRDMFATICIESGVDIPTVADWLGHSPKDGGKLLLVRYRKRRTEHSMAAAKKVTFTAKRGQL